MPSLIPCPKCGAYKYHSSNFKSSWERIRKCILHQKPYRCHECSYRGWEGYSISFPTITLKTVRLYFIIFVISVVFSILIRSFIK